MKAADKAFVDDVALLEHVLLVDDRVSRVLKLHCMTEVFLDRLLMRQLGCTSKKVADLDLTYSKKLRILEAAAAFDERALGWLRKLNTLRNKCAHRLAYQPKEKEIKDVSDAVPYPSNLKMSPQTFDEHITFMAAFMNGYLSSMTRERLSLVIK